MVTSASVSSSVAPPLVQPVRAAAAMVVAAARAIKGMRRCIAMSSRAGGSMVNDGMIVCQANCAIRSLRMCTCLAYVHSRHNLSAPRRMSTGAAVTENTTPPLSWEQLRRLPVPDWHPIAQLRLPATEVERAAYPAIDVHNHLGRWLSDGEWMIEEPDALVA